MVSESGKVTAVLLVFQVIFIVLFGVFVDYGTSADARHDDNNRDRSVGGADPDSNSLRNYYPMFQDVHVMIFVGFGFLMTFLKKYGYSSVGYNFLIAAFAVQWATLLTSFWSLPKGKATVDIHTLITSDFASAAVLISFGAVLGKASPFQLIIMTFIELVFFNINEHIGLGYLKVVDAGGSIFVHTFGAYFGITVARVIYKKGTHESPKEGSVYHSDLFAMIGTVFLWMFWPSFNSALVPAEAQHRAVINTYYSLAACCVTAFATSYLLGEKRRKFDMVHIQNSTLAGGVAVGTCGDMMIHPWGALLIGSFAGVLSVIGYVFFTPFLNSKKFHDTCGVHNLHGMPGIMAAIAGTIAAALATTDNYGHNLYTVFPARAPLEGSANLTAINLNYTRVMPGEDRSAGEQAGYQMLALVVTLAMAIVGGLVTGLILKLSCFGQPSVNNIFEDRLYWDVPEVGYHELSAEQHKYAVREDLKQTEMELAEGENGQNGEHQNGQQ